MGRRTILSVVGVDQSDGDIRLAEDFCRQIDGHLSVLVVSVAAPPPVGEFAAMVSEPWLEERQADMARLRERAAEVTDLLAGSAVPSDIDSAYADTPSVDDIVGRRARYADLALVGPELASRKRLESMVVKGVLFESQRPILILPDAARAVARPKRILVAWDSGLEASRAVHEALDLLADADDVRIAMVNPEATDRGNGQEPGADLATYLARHGAKVSVDRLVLAGHSIADALRIHAVDTSADMIVMGAYGHSRLRERIFGGVTQTMLEEPTLPVFMAR